MFSDEFDARHFMFHPRTIAAEGDMRRVLVPKETIARRTKVDDGDLRLAYIPATLLPQNAVTSPGDICNHITMTTLSRGQGISINLLCEEGNADSMLEVVVQTKNDSSLAGWMVQEGDQVLLGGPMGERPIFGGPRRATVTGTVCQVYPYRDEDRRLYGRRYVGETEFPIAVVLDRRELTEIGLKPEDLVFIGRC
jgi:hypothetical protein